MVGLEVIVETGKRPELLQLLEDFTTGVRVPRDRLWCGAFQDVSRDNRLLWVCRWNEDAGRRRFMRSDSYRTLLGAIRVLGRVADIRVIELPDHPSGRVGLPGLH